MASGDFKRKFENWQRNIQRSAAEWSYGRNGTDELGSAVANLAIVIIFVDLFINTHWLNWVGLVLITYAWFRISSKNITARARENEAAIKKAGPVVHFLANPLATIKENKEYVHLACPSCGQKVRIPRGKGKVRITCPKCHTRFDGKA